MYFGLPRKMDSGSYGPLPFCVELEVGGHRGSIGARKPGTFTGIFVILIPRSWLSLRFESRSLHSNAEVERGPVQDYCPQCYELPCRYGGG